MLFKSIYVITKYQRCYEQYIVENKENKICGYSLYLKVNYPWMVIIREC